MEKGDTEEIEERNEDISKRNEEISKDTRDSLDDPMEPGDQDNTGAGRNIPKGAELGNQIRRKGGSRVIPNIHHYYVLIRISLLNHFSSEKKIIKYCVGYTIRLAFFH